LGKLFHILQTLGTNEYQYVSVLENGTGTLFACALVVVVGSALVGLMLSIRLKSIKMETLLIIHPKIFWL